MLLLSYFLLKLNLHAGEKIDIYSMLLRTLQEISIVTSLRFHVGFFPTFPPAYNTKSLSIEYSLFPQIVNR